VCNVYLIAKWILQMFLYSKTVYARYNPKRGHALSMSNSKDCVMNCEQPATAASASAF
jgi:hypothetical protein